MVVITCWLHMGAVVMGHMRSCAPTLVLYSPVLYFCVCKKRRRLCVAIFAWWQHWLRGLPWQVLLCCSSGHTFSYRALTLASYPARRFYHHCDACSCPVLPEHLEITRTEDHLYRSGLAYIPRGLYATEGLLIRTPISTVAVIKGRDCPSSTPDPHWRGAEDPTNRGTTCHNQRHQSRYGQWACVQQYRYPPGPTWPSVLLANHQQQR